MNVIKPAKQASPQLSALEEAFRNPKVEQIAIASLDDASIEVARDAANALMQYGSPSAEAALWKRLEKFHEQWKDRPDEIRYAPGIISNQTGASGFQHALIEAITNGQAWFADQDSVRRLKDLSSSQMQQELDGILNEIEDRVYALNLNWWPEGTLAYTVGRYSGKGLAALREKLAQFPVGGRLELITTHLELDRHRAEFAELDSAVASDGLVLDVQTPR